jgi:DNA excision repair protein ERCC-4
MPKPLTAQLPCKLDPARLVALVDTREQKPLDLPGLAQVACTLATGDYSVRGLDHLIAIERKELSDLVACCGRDRSRFDREIQRLLGYPHRALVVEASWQDIESANWRSKMTAKAVGASLMSWMMRGLPVVLAGDRARAAGVVASMLRHSANQRYRELRTFAKEIGS